MPAKKTETVNPVETTKKPAHWREHNPEEVGRIVNDLKTYVNQSVRENGLRNVELADRLFRETFGDDTTAALDLQRKASPVYVGLQKEAGQSLLIDKSMLSRLVRIGAIDRLLPDARWQNLGWTLRVELLPLVREGGDLSLLKQGIQQAQRSGTGIRSLRNWVKEQLAETSDEEGAGRALPLKAGLRALEALAPLGKARARRIFAAEVEKLEPAARKAFLATLDETLATLGSLRTALAD